MKRYRLDVSRRAEKDAEAIFEWLAERSPDGAVNWYLALDDTLESLQENPERHARAREAEFLARDVRQASFKTLHGRSYRILFIITDETVQAVAVRGRGQDSVTPDNLDLPN